MRKSLKTDKTDKSPRVRKSQAKKNLNQAVRFVKNLWLADPTWPPKGDLEDALWRLLTARAGMHAAEKGLNPRRDIRPFPGGRLLLLPGDDEAGSVVVTRAIAGLGEKIGTLPERAKPAVVEVIALAEQVVPAAAVSLITAYENGDILLARFFAVVDNQWACIDIDYFLRSTAEEVLRAGGPLKAYRDDCGEIGDLQILRLYKKSVELYQKGVI